MTQQTLSMLRRSGRPREMSRLDDLIRRGLSECDDRRTVVTDQQARYFGAELRECSLIPGPHAVLGTTRFEDWLSRMPVAAR